MEFFIAVCLQGIATATTGRPNLLNRTNRAGGLTSSSLNRITIPQTAATTTVAAASASAATTNSRNSIVQNARSRPTSSSSQQQQHHDLESKIRGSLNVYRHERDELQRKAHTAKERVRLIKEEFVTLQKREEITRQDERNKRSQIAAKQAKVAELQLEIQRLTNEVRKRI